jgi:hypothetical protein
VKPYFALRATKGIRSFRRKRKMAERVGFEPTEPCGSPVFKTGAIDHSTTSPDAGFARKWIVIFSRIGKRNPTVKGDFIAIHDFWRFFG